MTITIQEFNAVVNDGLDEKFREIVGNWLDHKFVCDESTQIDMLVTLLLQAVEAKVVDEFRHT